MSGRVGSPSSRPGRDRRQPPVPQKAAGGSTSRGAAAWEVPGPHPAPPGRAPSVRSPRSAGLSGPQVPVHWPVLSPVLSCWAWGAQGHSFVCFRKKIIITGQRLRLHAVRWDPPRSGPPLAGLCQGWRALQTLSLQLRGLGASRVHRLTLSAASLSCFNLSHPALPLLFTPFIASSNPDTLDVI